RSSRTSSATSSGTNSRRSTDSKARQTRFPARTGERFARSGSRRAIMVEFKHTTGPDGRKAEGGKAGRREGGGRKGKAEIGKGKAEAGGRNRPDPESGSMQGSFGNKDRRGTLTKMKIFVDSPAQKLSI